MRSFPSLLALTTLFILSCGGGDGTTTPPPPTGDDPTPIFEETRAVSAVIPPAGGTIEATSADGDLITVTIPAGATATDIALTIVPVSGVEDLPFAAGLAGGVDIRPHEVLFSRNVTVTIQPSAPVAGVGIVFEIDEIEEPAGARANQVTRVEIAPGVFVVQCEGQVPVQWTVGIGLSGTIGIAQSSVAEALDLMGSTASTTLKARVKQHVAAGLYSEANLNAFVASNCDRLVLLPEAERLLKSAYTAVLRPALVAAGASDGFDFFEVMRAYLAWQADLALFGILGDDDVAPLLTEGQDLLDAAAVNAARKFLDQCDEEGFDGLVLSVLGRKGLKSLLALPALGILSETADFNTEGLLANIRECLDCEDPSILDVRTPERPLKESRGDFIVNFTGSTTENTRFIWDFGPNVLPAERISEQPSPNIALPATPGDYTGQVIIENDCSVPGTTESLVFSYTVLDCEDAPEFDIPPVVLSVTPSADLLTGTQVTFSANIEGPASEFTWDFGGAITGGQISNEPEPLVTLAAAREEPYVGTLTVGNVCRTSEVFFFDILVTEECREGTAITISGVSPSSGVEGEVVQFSATVTGTPISFAWTFGGGATPDTSTEATPFVELGAIGSYNGAVTIADECEDETFPFTYEVTAQTDPYRFLYKGTLNIAGSDGEGNPCNVSLELTEFSEGVGLNSDGIRFHTQGSGDWGCASFESVGPVVCYSIQNKTAAGFDIFTGCNTPGATKLGEGTFSSETLTVSTDSSTIDGEGNALVHFSFTSTSRDGPF